MMPEDSLRLILKLLEKYGIEYMITGSFAGNMHGVPRTTYDADIVIEPNASSLTEFIDSLQTQFYADSNMAQQALRGQGMFNVVHYETGFKTDLIIRKSRHFSVQEFNRKKSFSFLGELCWFATCEDTLLMKLEWFRMGESQRQLQDAIDIARVQGDDMDIDYLRYWAGQLGVSELLQEVLRQAGLKA